MPIYFKLFLISYWQLHCWPVCLHNLDDCCCDRDSRPCQS